MLKLAEFPGWALGWQRPDRRPIYEWAADYLTLPGSYGIPGKFDVSVRRPLMAVFDAISDPLVRRVRFRKPPRFGGSLINDLAIPWIVVNDPGPIMWNWQKDEAALEHMREKAWPLWRSCKPFMGMLPQGPAARHEVTATEIYFGSFFFKTQGANPNNLQGKGIRWQFNEEVWLPVWQTLYNQAVSRTRDYAETQCEKIVDVSQAGLANQVEDRNYREGSQHLWHYRAPNGKLVPLVMGGKREDGSRWGLVWSDDAKRADGSYSRARAIETARYVCRETGHEWRDCPETRAEWNRSGEYVSMNPDAPAAIRSFSAPALLNNTFAALVTRKLNALEQASYGDMSGMKDVKMQDECEAWQEESYTVTIESTSAGYKLADYEDGKLLDGEKYRTLMADRQQGMRGDTPHRWVEVRAWRADGSSRQLFWGRVDTKEGMREIQQKYGVRDRCVWQDAGFEKHEVFKECAEYGWIACFGSDQGSWMHILPNSDRTKEPLKLRYPFSPWQRTEALGKVVNYLYFSEDYCADIAANLVAGRGVPYEWAIDTPESYKEQLKGEHKVIKNGKPKWEKIHSTKANHSWDVSKMGIAFALLMRLLALAKKPEEDSQAA